ncbi:MAG: MFS transporter [archaeon]
MEPFKRITMVHAAFAFGVVLVDPIFSLYLSNKGYDPITLSILFSAFSLASIFTAPLIGGISDNWGRRPVILGGILATMIAYTMYFWYDSAWLIFIARILEGIGYNAVVLVCVAKLEDLVSQQKEKKNTHSRIGTSLSIGKLGHVIGPLVGALIAARMGFESPFLFAVLCLGSLALWYFFQHHHVHPVPPLQKLIWNPIPLWKDYFQSKPFRGLTALVMTHQFSVAVMFAFLPLYLVQRLNFPIEHVGLVLFVRELPQLMQHFAGKMTDNWGSKKVSILGTSLAGIAMIGLAFSSTFESILFAVFVYGVGTSMLGIGSIAMLSGFAEKKKREGAILGTHVSISKIGALIAFLVSGILVESAGMRFLFAMSGTLLLLGVIIAEEKMGMKSFPTPKARELSQLLFHHR